MSVFDMCACLPKHPWLLRCRSPQASRQTPTRSLCSRSLIIHSLISPSTQERRKEYTASPLMLGETGRCWSRHWHLTRVLAPHIYEFQVHWIMQINKRALWKPSLKKKKKKKSKPDISIAQYIHKRERLQAVPDALNTIRDKDIDLIQPQESYILLLISTPLLPTLFPSRFHPIRTNCEEPLVGSASGPS